MLFWGESIFEHALCVRLELYYVSFNRRLSRDDFTAVLSDIGCILGDVQEKYCDLSKNEVFSLSQHTALFQSVVLRPNDVVLNKMMSAFSPELHVGEVVERLVLSTRVVVSALDAVLLLLTKCAHKELFRLRSCDMCVCVSVGLRRNRDELLLTVSQSVGAGQRLPVTPITQEVIATGTLVNVMETALDPR